MDAQAKDKRKKKIVSENNNPHEIEAIPTSRPFQVLQTSAYPAASPTSSPQLSYTRWWEGEHSA